MCSLCAVRCKVLEVSGEFVKEQPFFAGDMIYAKINVSPHVPYHVSYHVSYDVSYHVSCPVACPTTPQTSPVDNC